MPLKYFIQITPLDILKNLNQTQTEIMQITKNAYTAILRQACPGSFKNSEFSVLSIFYDKKYASKFLYTSILMDKSIFVNYLLFKN